MSTTPGNWFYRDGIIENGSHVICQMNNIGDKVEADANLILMAVRACTELNPTNPTIVAANISALYESLDYIIRELDKAGVIKANSIFMDMPNRVLTKVKAK